MSGELTATFNIVEYSQAEVSIEAETEADARWAYDMLSTSDLDGGKVLMRAPSGETVYVTVTRTLQDSESEPEDDDEWEGDDEEDS